MGYTGIVPSEHSSGERAWRGAITKTGNAHLRRVVVEAAWSYRHRPAVGGALQKRQSQLAEDVKEIAWKAQHRLHGRYRALRRAESSKAKAVTAVARELLGFIWAIGVKVEQQTPRVSGDHRGVAKAASDGAGSGSGRGAHGKENPRSPSMRRASRPDPRR